MNQKIRFNRIRLSKELVGSLKSLKSASQHAYSNLLMVGMHSLEEYFLTTANLKEDCTHYIPLEIFHFSVYIEFHFDRDCIWISDLSTCDDPDPDPDCLASPGAYNAQLVFFSDNADIQRKIFVYKKRKRSLEDLWCAVNEVVMQPEIWVTRGCTDVITKINKQIFKEKFERKKALVNVGTLGNVDHGKAMLTAVLATYPTDRMGGDEIVNVCGQEVDNAVMIGHVDHGKTELAVYEENNSDDRAKVHGQVDSALPTDMLHRTIIKTAFVATDSYRYAHIDYSKRIAGVCSHIDNIFFAKKFGLLYTPAASHVSEIFIVNLEPPTQCSSYSVKVTDNNGQTITNKYNFWPNFNNTYIESTQSQQPDSSFVFSINAITTTPPVDLTSSVGNGQYLFTVKNDNVCNSNRKLSRTDAKYWQRRVIVRGMAMNLPDHPHGDGEGYTLDGRHSASPWSISAREFEGMRCQCSPHRDESFSTINCELSHDSKEAEFAMSCSSPFFITARNELCETTRLI